MIISAKDAKVYPAAKDTTPEARMIYKQICSASFWPEKSILAFENAALPVLIFQAGVYLVTVREPLMDS